MWWGPTALGLVAVILTLGGLGDLGWRLGWLRRWTAAFRAHAHSGRSGHRSRAHSGRSGRSGRSGHRDHGAHPAHSAHPARSAHPAHAGGALSSLGSTAGEADLAPAQWTTVALGGTALAFGVLTLTAGVIGVPPEAITPTEQAAAPDGGPISAVLGVAVGIVGIAFLAIVLRPWSARRRNGSARCELETDPAALGDWFKARVETRDTLGPQDTVRVKLTNFRRVTGADGRPHFVTYWSHAYRLRPDMLEQQPGGRLTVPVRFLLPADAQPTGSAPAQVGGTDDIVWKLELQAGDGWQVAFDVPVLAQAPAASTDRATDAEPAPPAGEPAFAGVGTGPAPFLSVGAAPGRAASSRGWLNADGGDDADPAPRHPDVVLESEPRAETGAMLALAAFLLVVIAAGWRSLVAGSTWLAACFGLLALASTAGLIACATHSWLLTADRRGIALEHRLAGLRWCFRWRRDEVLRVQIVQARRPWPWTVPANWLPSTGGARSEPVPTWIVEIVDATDRAYRMAPFTERGKATWLAVRLGDTLGVPVQSAPAVAPSTASASTPASGSMGEPALVVNVSSQPRD